MDRARILNIAAEWIAHKGRYCAAWQELDDSCRENPTMAFQIIEEIHHRIADGKPINYQLMAILAAGPLEALIVHNGSTVIDRIESLASHDIEFRKCLTGVWRSGTPNELFARVQKAAHPNFKL